jgi:Eukaryotic glutathione synthase, ATP binding domain
MRKYDVFLDRLAKVSETFNERRRSGQKVQNVQMVFLRADYMVDWPTDFTRDPSLKLVEFNTVAAGMLPVTARTCQVQNYVAGKYASEFLFEYENQGDLLYYARQEPALAGNFFLNSSQSQID